ncbi:MAG TPA: alpha/beta hydrolase [Bryobacteraceae bacterium]|nr:alpha/beta hydrolase [Bryobacteraceae bacterium]
MWKHESRRLTVFSIRAAHALLALAAAVNAGCAKTAVPESQPTSSSCPDIQPMHGLLPVLFGVGLLPKPPIATSIAPGDSTSSTIIHPDSTRQITCGKVATKDFNDIVFAHPTLGSGKSSALKLDILVPQPPKMRPLVLYVTGGGFSRAPKEAALNLRTYVAEAGFVVASLQYRTVSDGANYRDGISDVKSAIRFLRANAEQFGIDPEHVAVWGESAGGYLAAMAGLTNSSKAFESGENLDQSSDVQAVIDKFGASDISQIAADFDAKAKAQYADTNSVTHYVGQDVDTRANPLTYIRADAPPFLIFHGSKDRLVSPSQTLMLHNALLAAGAHSTRYVLDGADHGDLAFMGDKKSGLPWSARETMDIIVDFLKRSLGADAGT